MICECVLSRGGRTAPLVTAALLGEGKRTGRTTKALSAFTRGSEHAQALLFYVFISDINAPFVLLRFYSIRYGTRDTQRVGFFV